MNKPQQSRPFTPADFRRMGELTGRELSPDEQAESDKLTDRFLEMSESKDWGGTAYRGEDGKVYAPSTERRLRRILRVQKWKQRRERERLENLLSAIEAQGNIFARMGNLWVVAYRGRRAIVPDFKGMEYIRLVLKNAASDTGTDGGLTPAELCGKVHKLPPELLPDEDTLCRAFESGTNEDDEENPLEYSTKYDRDTIDHRDTLDARGRLEAPAESKGFHLTQEQYAEVIKQLKNELHAAKESKNTSEVRRIQKTLRELGEGDPKRQRRPPEPKAERARTRVAKAIRRAFDDLQKQHAAAAEHLRATVKTENGRWEYRGSERFTT